MGRRKHTGIDEDLMNSKVDALGIMSDPALVRPDPGPAAAPQPAADDAAPGEDGAISLDYFANVNLRVGRIVDVEDLEGARKPMYRLRVDLGELGMRNLVAGIKAFYTKNELVGRKIIVVANLEPKKIAGAMSEGMLLAAEDGGVVSLLQPDRDMREGSSIG